jgi:hypothetical protein
LKRKGIGMDRRRIRKALREDRFLMCTYEGTGPAYSLDNGIAVPRKLAAELTGAGKLQADLFLRPNDDGLFPTALAIRARAA